MADFFPEWRFDVLSAPLSATGTTYTLASMDGLTLLRISGSGFTYSAGVPTGGVISSIEVVLVNGGSVAATITGITTPLTDLGALIGSIEALQAQVTWANLIVDPDATIVTATLVRLLNTDGSFTEIVGTGMDPHGFGNFAGSVSAIRHVASDGVTVITNVAVSTSFQMALSALIPVHASGQAFALLGAGANTMVATNTITVGADTYHLFPDDTPGSDAITSSAISFAYSSVGITVDLGAGSAVIGADTNTLTGVLSVIGTDLADSITGNSGANTFFGFDGNDILIGGAGNDELAGGVDDDFLNGGDGDDLLDGGFGYDTASYREALGGVTVSLAITTAQNTGAAGIDTLGGVDNLYGSDFADTLTGGDFNNVLNGYDGDDVLSGGAGPDTLIGGAGNDTLTGGTENDILVGNTGRDVASYNLASGGVSWFRNPNGVWTVVTGSQGNDTLVGVEFLDFTDRDVFLDRAAQSFTGDGTSDLLLRHTNGTLSLWFVQGGAISGAGVGSISADWSPQSGDFNGDGRDDILWRNTTNGAMSMWFMNGAAVTGASFGNVATNWVIEGLGDFNGDTRDDILWRNTSTGDMSIWFLDGTSVSGGAFGNVNSGWVIETLGDFNGDGRDDILWRETASGAMSMWFMNGQAVTGGAFGTVGAPWVVEGAGDFNLDGRDDIFWRNSATGDVSLWFMNGQTVTGFAGFGLSTAWDAAALGDYNGDGRDDVIWRDVAGNMVAWFINGASVTGQSLGTLSTDWVINPGG